MALTEIGELQGIYDASQVGRISKEVSGELLVLSGAARRMVRGGPRPQRWEPVLRPTRLLRQPSGAV